MNEKYNVTEYQKYKEMLVTLEKEGNGNSKMAHQIRATIIPLWNKLTPEQQREMSQKYILE